MQSGVRDEWDVRLVENDDASRIQFPRIDGTPSSHSESLRITSQYLCSRRYEYD